MAQKPVSGNTHFNRTVFICDQVRMRNISSTAAGVAHCMNRFADAGGYCWTSNGKLGSMSGYGPRTVQRAKKELVERGILVMAGWRGKEGRFTRAYRFTPGVSPVSHKGNGKIMPISAQNEGSWVNPAFPTVSPVTPESK